MEEKNKEKDEKGDELYEIPMEEDTVLSSEEIIEHSFSHLSKKLSLIQKLGGLIDNRLDIHSLTNRIMDIVMEAIDAEAGSILQVDESKEELFFQAARGEKAEDVMKFRVPIGKGIAGWSALHSETLAVSDVHKEPRFYKEISESLGFETRSILCVPINIRDRVWGVIEVINKVASDVFDSDEIDLIKGIAYISGLLIHNRSSILRYEKRIQDLVEILDLNLKLLSSKDIDDSSRLVIESVERAFRPGGTSLILKSRENPKVLLVFYRDIDSGELVSRQVEDASLNPLEMEVLGKSKALFFKNVAKELKDDEVTRAMIPVDIGSLIYLPFTVTGESMGMIKIENSLDDRCFGYDDLKVLNALVRQAIPIIYRP